MLAPSTLHMHAPCSVCSLPLRLYHAGSKLAGGCVMFTARRTEHAERQAEKLLDEAA